MITKLANKINVLLVEDNIGDVDLASEVFKECTVANRLYVVNDGVEAMEFLAHSGKYADVPRPDIILLDLNLPRKDGREVLAEIKQDTQLRSIPIVILTTSTFVQDIETCYNLQANCYVTKPLHLDDYINTINGIQNFWFPTLSR